ncbi:uracil-DNA glycosylase family protein [Lentibacillus juripiscarius]|uniref:Uracil-DNA glycosylase family protein n=1 Tax=Lentibacillus juripiscarius TaxID=257446 RepID=A0ABW5V5I5_9BACI
MLHTSIQHFLPFIGTLSNDRPLTKQDLLTASLLMEKSGDIRVYYAPHNDSINKAAKIVIVGITPGWRQMKIAFEQFVDSLSSGDTVETCLNEAKQAARFAGSMRKNLLHMLDECGIPNALGIPSSADLFGNSRNFLHTTSIIKYPVFIKGKNYTGHQPPIHRSALLKHYAYNIFPDELAQIHPPALVIPLGKTVEQTIVRLAEEQMLPNHTYLTGFPHPSGANGHRVRQFQQQKQQLQEKVRAWAGGGG